jgi:hypothetical protein
MKADRETFLHYLCITCVAIAGVCYVISMVCDLLIKHGYGP